MNAQAKTADTDKKAPVFLIFGNDEYPVSVNAKKTVERLCPPDQQAFGLEIIEGAVETVAEAVAAIQQCLGALRTVSFLMGGNKVVWLRDVTFLSDSTKAGKAVDTKAELAKLTAEIKAGWGDEQILIINAGKVDKRSAFYKACKAQGELMEYALPERGGQAEKTIRARAKQMLAREGLTMDQAAFNAFMDRTGIDTRLIGQEITKLLLYLGGKGQVSKEVVDLIVAPSREEMGYALTDAVGRRNMMESLSVLKRLVFQKAKPFVLMISLEKMFSQFLILQAALDRGWLRIESSGSWTQAKWAESDEVEQGLSALGNDNPKKMHPFRLAKLAEQARGFSREELVYYLERVIQTHERMISAGHMPQELLLELLIIEIAGRYRRAG